MRWRFSGLGFEGLGLLDSRLKPLGEVRRDLTGTTEPKTFEAGPSKVPFSVELGLGF